MPAALAVARPPRRIKRALAPILRLLPKQDRKPKPPPIILSISVPPPAQKAPQPRHNRFTFANEPAGFRWDSRAEFAQFLIDNELLPHEDEDALIADYWRLLMGEENVPEAIQNAADFRLDATVQMLTETTILGGLEPGRAARIVGATPEVIEAYRLLFYDIETFNLTIKQSLMERFSQNDPTSILPSIALAGGWRMVEMALGLCRWSLKKRCIMDRLISKKANALLMQKWDRTCEKLWRKERQNKIVELALRLNNILELDLV